MCLGSSKEQFHPISLGYVGAVSSHIINLFLLLLDHQIIIFQLLLGHLIIICWLCMLYLRAFQGKGFLTVKTKDPLDKCVHCTINPHAAISSFPLKMYHSRYVYKSSSKLTS